MSFIDLHCHTIASKSGSGESKKRNVKDKNIFLKKLSDAEVTVVAITNHNYFSVTQYDDFANNNSILVLPGIEIDVTRKNGEICHLILINNNEKDEYNKFKEFIIENNLDKIENANSYGIKLADLIKKVNDLDCIIIVHYGSKSNAFNDDEIDFIKKNCDKPLYVEPSSLISAFIYINKGMDSIIGSDVKDWDNYPGKELPELKVNIASFQMLKLLLKKDGNIIEEKMNVKKHDFKFEINNTEYNIHEEIELFRDCNVIIGSKSSGKSIFLRAIFDFLKSKGKGPNISYYDSLKVKEEYDKLMDYTPTSEEINAFTKTNDNCKNDIIKIKDFSLPTFENIFPKIEEYITITRGKELSKQLGFVETISNFPDNNSQFMNYKDDIINKSNMIINFIKEKPYDKFLNEKEKVEIELLLNKSFDNLLKDFIINFKNNKSNIYANKCIMDFKRLFEKYKAVSTMPNTTGLKELYEKKRDVINSAYRIKKCFDYEPNINTRRAGYLDGKGNIKICHIIDYMNRYNKDTNKLKDINILKGDCETFYLSIEKILDSKYSFSMDIINKISTMIREKNIESIKDFIGYNSFFVRENGNKFDPSKGEQSIIILNHCLNNDNPEIDYYLLDEPEMSVGHKYINEIIVPRLKQLSKNNKTIILCTHDANICVGTLPFQVVYREEDNDGIYHTYCGNPFINKLIEIHDASEMKWTDVVVSVLEGGRDALDIREVTYGDKK